MDKLFCKHCHQEVTFIIEKKANNNVSFCTVCGCFIKNVPNSHLGIKTVDHTFPFGKYKGLKVYHCTDESYLRWAFENLTKMSDGFMECICNRIEELATKKL